MSNAAQGFMKALGVAPEVAFDDYVAATAWLAVKEPVEMLHEMQTLDAASLNQKPYGVESDLAIGQKSWSTKFDCVMPVKSLAFKELLKGLFGGVDTEGSDPYTHEFVLAADPLVGGVSLTAWLGDGASQVCASGGRVRGLTLKGEANDFINASFDMMGATYLPLAKAGSPAVTLATVPWFKFSHATVKVATVATEFGGFQIDIKPSLVSDVNTAFVLGNDVPTRLPYGGKWDISGNFTRRWLDDTPSTALESQFLTLARAQAATAIEITLNAGSNMTAVIDAEVVFGTPTRGGTGIIVETIPWKVVAKASGAEAKGPFVLVTTDDEATPIDAP